MAGLTDLGPRARRLARAAFWCCAAALLYLALTPVQVVPVRVWDKAEHMLAFAVLTWLALAGWPAQRVRLLGLVLAYGVLIELLQALTPTRQADWRDVVADAVGIALSYAIARMAGRLAASRQGLASGRRQG